MVKTMNFKERAVIFLTFLVSCLAIALLAGGLGTNYWVVSTATRESNVNKSSGHINFGLFVGDKRLNHGFGERHFTMDIIDIVYHERTFLVKELFIATIACICVGIFFGLVAACLAVVNTASNPSEYICQMPGLMLWNSLASIAGIAAVITWIVQFYVKLFHNVLQREDVANGGWTSAGRAKIGHSFWLVVIATGCFIFNVGVVHLLSRRQQQQQRSMYGSSTKSSSKKQLMSDSKPNGNLMLY